MPFGRNLILKVAALKPIEALVRRSFLFKPLVRRFIAGDTLAEAMVAAEKLCDAGLLVTLDYLGENTKSREEALNAVRMYQEILTAIGQSRHRDKINISIKLTQCGLDQGEDFAVENYRGVVAEAAKQDTFVRVDMEASEYTERTVSIVSKVFGELKNTGTVLQSYLHRSMDDTRHFIRLGTRIRVVKGAYLEPAEVAIVDKPGVDRQYVEMAKLLVAEGNYPAIATHDETIIKEITAFAAENGIPHDRYEFQMLYGIRRDLQDKLSAEGHPVRVYVPYGDMWYPYFSRRLAERPANAMFILKSLVRG